ncbi:hypothetical protein NM688_g8668 [Phlebia brevispora]|uniref:Uncharacterized protein n=1 Tax=Phlebia brevispora TaxID=194682 RepID=A0ACC1RRV1_9APHY|nr:hypothetical protein NM688_g8668 [Phlebia brevispora]
MQMEDETEAVDAVEDDELASSCRTRLTRAETDADALEIAALLAAMLLLLPLLALFALPLAFALSPEETQAELSKLAQANNGVIKLDERTFDLLTAPQRTWSSTIVFTALDPRRKCGPCKEFQPSFNTVAKAWTKVPEQERNLHFFGTIDFDEAMTVFQKLSMQSAPVVYVYPATEGSHKPANGRTDPLSYDFSNGYDPEPLAEQLSRHTPVPIPYKPPVDWSKLLFALGCGLIGLVALRFIAPILKSKWTWGIITIVTSLIMISGHMFVRIRGMPYSGSGGQWIASGYQNQFGQETQVVAMMYGLLGASFVMLTMVVPYQLSPKRQQAQVWLWTIVIFIMYSVLISLFRVKNRGYPFKLLL